MSKYSFVCVSPHDLALLQQASVIDNEAFGSDGISIFNLAQFAFCGSLFCLLNGKQVVAEAVMLRNLQNQGAVIFGFAVAKQQRGQGLGTLLVEHLFKAAQKAEITHLELTFNPDNQAAKELYMHKAGFYLKTELPNHPQKGEPRWLLRRDLSA